MGTCYFTLYCILHVYSLSNIIYFVDRCGQWQMQKKQRKKIIHRIILYKTAYVPKHVQITNFQMKVNNELNLGFNLI